MKNFICIIFLSIFSLCLSLQALGNCTVKVTLDGVVGPASLDSLERAHEMAKKKECSQVLALINTPGGSLHSTRLMVQLMLNSKIPFLCLIAPSGAHAGSAGAILLQACHVSGGITATNLGAATPISSDGKDINKDLRKKILNDTMSWVEGLVKLRGRNLKFGRDIIKEAKAVSISQAVKEGAVDFEVQSEVEFFKKSLGRKVQVAGENNFVEIKEPGQLIEIKSNLRSKILELTTDPQTAYLMFMGSLGLLYFELTHPGMLLPGIVGGIGLIVSLVSLHKLNVQWGGLALILLGILLMVAEAFVASFGALGVGGVLSFLLGSLYLFDENLTGYSLPLSLILPVVFMLSFVTFGLAIAAYRAMKVKSKDGVEEIIGKEAKVVKVTADLIQVEFNGEIWSAIEREGFQVGERVIISSVSGLKVSLKKIESES